MNTKTLHSPLRVFCLKERGFIYLFFSSRIQSSYAALQRINQDLEDKMHRTVRDPQPRFNLILLCCLSFQSANRFQCTFYNVHTPKKGKGKKQLLYKHD